MLLGNIVGVSGQRIKRWARRHDLAGYRVGESIMVPKETVAEYVRRAGASLDLEEIPDDEAARLVAEGRGRH